MELWLCRVVGRPLGDVKGPVGYWVLGCGVWGRRLMKTWVCGRMMEECIKSMGTNGRVRGRDARGCPVLGTEGPTESRREPGGSRLPGTERGHSSQGEEGPAR